MAQSQMMNGVNVSKSSASVTHPQGENKLFPESASVNPQEAQASAVSDFAPGIESAFPIEFAEHDLALDCIEGEVPSFVRGFYFLNGPARFGSKDLRYQHWLDGDGMVCCVRFGREGIRLRNRYVQSTKFVEEREAGRLLFRTFGTTFSGSRLNRAGNGLESPVNVSVYPFGDHLLAFGEQGLPWKLDRDTLETRGEFSFNGRLNSASPFAAHPKFDFDSGEMFNFGIFFSPQAPKLYLYCFGREGLRFRKAVALDYPCSVHDFALSKHYAIFYVSPYLLDTRRLLEDQSTLMDALRWEPQRGSRLLLVARSNGELKASVPVGNLYCLHLINAFEQDDRLVVDLLELDEPIYSQYQPVPDLLQDVSSGGPVRLAIDVAKSELVERSSLPYLQAPDFPAIDNRLAMRPYRDFWMLGISSAGKNGRKFYDQLVHGRWESPAQMDIYTSDPMRYLSGEPVFIGDPQSADGVVMCQELVAQEQTSNFLLFDAHEVSKGPIARIRTNIILYLGFHAAFQPAT